MSEQLEKSVWARKCPRFETREAGAEVHNLNKLREERAQSLGISTKAGTVLQVVFGSFLGDI